MDTTGLIDKAEKYLRDFIVYLLSFFDRRAHRRGASDLNQTVVFGILSASIGTYLWNRYLYHDLGTVADGAGLVVDKILEWSINGVVIFAALWLAGLVCKVLDAILCAIRTMAVAQIIAVAIAYLVLTVVPPFYDMSDTAAAYVSYVVYLGLVLRYLPEEIAKLKFEPRDDAVVETLRLRFGLANGVVLAIVFLLFMASHTARSYCEAPGSDLAARRATHWCHRYEAMHPPPVAATAAARVSGAVTAGTDLATHK